MNAIASVSAIHMALHRLRNWLPDIILADGSVRRDSMWTEATPLLLAFRGDVTLANGAAARRISTVMSIKNRDAYHVTTQRLFPVRPDVTFFVCELSARKTQARSIALVAMQTTADGDIIQTLFTDDAGPLATVVDTSYDTWTDAD